MITLGFTICISAITIISAGTFVDGEKAQCEVIAAKVALENQNTVVDTTFKRLIGTWLSEGCEIRPGPEYVLRSYTFKEFTGKYTLQYKAVQHHYWDDSCSNPKITITSYGRFRFKLNSAMNPGAAAATFYPVNITVVPQDSLAAKELDAIQNSECDEQNFKPWRKYEEYTVFDENTYQTTKHSLLNSPQFTVNAMPTQRHLPPSSVGDIACLGSLKWAFNELKLAKIQFRPIFKNIHGSLNYKHVRLELLLGDIHSRLERREYYTPTSFQTPLLKYTREDENAIELGSVKYKIKNVCNICANLYSSEKSPPHLLEKPHLPPYIWGEWTSVRCEVRPMGLFLTRKFSFYSDDSVWIGEHKFYQDPFCTIPKFVVTAAGHFVMTSSSGVIEGATNVDFKIERASLTVFTKRMLHEMRIFASCGRENWEVGVPQELSSSNGCVQLGIVIPSIQYEIIKVEMSYEGSCLLYLGQADTENMPRSSGERPTAFQEPLIKCGEVPNYSNSLRDVLSGDSDYDDGLYNKADCYSANYHTVLFSIILMIFFV